MKLNRLISIAIASLFVTMPLYTTGCARLYNSDEYNISDTNTQFSYRLGQITFVKNVKLRDDGSGKVIGAGTGLVLGSMVGSGKGKTLALLIGGLGGALIGHFAGKGNAQELGIKLDDGSEIVVVVKGSEEFHRGERVRIIYDGAQIKRVEHY